MFEFWPGWLFYLPVWVWIAWLTIRHRGLRLPLISNPLLPAGGLVGEQKTRVLDSVGPGARAYVAPYISFTRSGASAEDDAVVALDRLRSAGLALPIVAKPDLGCRGAGVRPIRAREDLVTYLVGFPRDETLLLQTLVDVRGEAGVFYVRKPGEARGKIISLTLKYFPHVRGDGRSTLRELILADPRAGVLSHLYLPRHTERLDEVLRDGEFYRLAFAGSHSRGAIFRNGNAFITSAMEARFDALTAEIPEFWFGRFDIRFANFSDVQRGEGFRIVEINGAGAEATHIWDSRTRLWEAYRTLFHQFALLWEIGARNHRRGFRPEPFRTFIARWRREKRLIGAYPPTA